MSHIKAMLQIIIVNVVTGYDGERGGGVKFLNKWVCGLCMPPRLGLRKKQVLLVTLKFVKKQCITKSTNENFNDNVIMAIFFSKKDC